MTYLSSLFLKVLTKLASTTAVLHGLSRWQTD